MTVTGHAMPGPARVTTHHGPSHLLPSAHPVLRRFWYAACFSADVTGAPVARTILGEKLVIWREAPGRCVSVALDRCAHRDAPLSRGWVANCHLVCPYHGWEWDAAGKTKRIPQFPGSPFPAKSGLTMVAAQERYGLVWVCLDGDPIAGIPPVPEYGAPGWRVVPEYEYRFDCTAMHLLEIVLRTDTEQDRPAADILAFDVAVEDEDRSLLETLPTPFPLAPHLNAHARADRNSLAIRRMWTELVTGTWKPSY